jgi:putative DNA primase/helicase
VTSADLNRNLEEDISFTPLGIKDFGVWDMGDARKGKRTPIEIVMEWNGCELEGATQWLCRMLGQPSPFEQQSANETIKAPVTPIDLWGHLNRSSRADCCLR